MPTEQKGFREQLVTIPFRGELVMFWLDLAKGSEKVRHVFGDDFVLEGVELSSVLLHDGPSVEFSFGRCGLPDGCPEKWIDQGYNSFVVRLRLIMVTSLHIEGWDIGGVCAPEFSKTNGGVLMDITSDKSTIRCEARVLRVQGVTGHIDEACEKM